VKKSVFGWCLSAMLGLSSLLPMSTATAQQGDVAPALVVSVGPAGKVLEDLLYLTKSVGQPMVGGMAKGVADQFLAPIDQKRPMGMYLTLDSGAPEMVVFAPVSDFDGLVDLIAENAGDPEVDGDYTIFSLPNGENLYLTEEGDWTFAAQNDEALENLPGDPGAWIEEMSSYTLGVRVLAGNVPTEMKEMAMSQIREGYEQVLDSLPPDQAEQQRAMSGMQMDQLEEMVEQLDELVVGLAVDSKAKELHLDFAVTAVEGSQMAEQMALQSDAESAYLGFLLADAAMNMAFAQKISPADAEQGVQAMEQAMEQAMSQMADEAGNMTDEQRELVEGFVGALKDSLAATVRSGRMDAGASIVLDDETTALVAAVYALETGKIEDSIKAIVKAIGNEAPPGVEFNLDARKDKTANWHEIVIPVPAGNAEAQKMFGESVSIWLGVADEALYVAAGRNGEEVLKRALSGSGQAVEGRSAEINMDFGRVIDFVAGVQADDPMAQMMADAVKGKNASMSMYSEAIDNGSRSRIVIREDLLKVLGEVGTMFSQQGGAQF